MATYSPIHPLEQTNRGGSNRIIDIENGVGEDGHAFDKRRKKEMKAYHHPGNEFLWKNTVEIDLSGLPENMFPVIDENII